MSKHILEIDSASYRFRDESKVRRAYVYGFSCVSLNIEKGEFISIIGPSGSGKSTLLRAIAGLIDPTDGKITRQFSRAAMVFQGHGLFPWLSALDNVAFGLKMADKSKSTRERIALKKLEEVGLKGFERRLPHELSGGQRQRVSIARALAVSPDLLLLDEPFASLDSITASHLKRDLIKLWRRYKMTVVMVSHGIADAVELTDRVAVFSASPGTLKAITAVKLPRPRNTRSTKFFTLVDKLTRMIEG